MSVIGKTNFETVVGWEEKGLYPPRVPTNSLNHSSSAPGDVDRQLELEMPHGARHGTCNVPRRKPVTPVRQLNHPMVQLSEMTLWQTKM